MLDAQRLRKVAILVDSLDAERADALLDQMPEKQRAMIRNLVVSLDNITDDERESVIAEFLGPNESAQPSYSESAGASADMTDHDTRPLVTDVNSSLNPYAASESYVSPGHEASSRDAKDTNDSKPSASSTNAQTTQLGSPADDVWLETSFPYNDWTSPTRDHSESPNSTITEHAHQEGDFRESRSRHWEQHQEVTIGAEDRDSRDDDTPQTTRRSDPPSATRLPFSFLKDEDAERIARFIECEQPQMIARVISCLRPRLAASIVTSLMEPVRRDVLKRIPNMQESDESVVAELERYVLSRLTAESSTDECDLDAPGFKSLEAILEAADEDERIRMIESLRRERPELDDYLRFRYPNVVSDCNMAHPQSVQARPETAPTERESVGTSVEALSQSEDGEGQASAAHTVQSDILHELAEVGPQESNRTEEDDNIALRIAASGPDEDWLLETEERVSLDVLSQLDDQSFAKLLGEADATVVLIALAGAEPKLLDNLLRLIPKREAKQVKRRIEQIGPIRLQDIERAQRELAHRALEIIEERATFGHGQRVHANAA